MARPWRDLYPQHWQVNAAGLLCLALIASVRAAPGTGGANDTSLSSTTPPKPAGSLRPHHRMRSAAAHDWACGMVNGTLSRLTAFVISGSNVMDSRAAAVRRTWGAALAPGRLLVFSDGNGTAHAADVVLEGTAGDHAGSQKKWPLAFQKYCGGTVADLVTRNSTDWLLVADDDTYVFLPNLAVLLATGFSPDWPYVLGRPWRAEGRTYPCGGPGYVLSRAAVDRMCARVDDILRLHWPSYWSDINMGGFLRALNITFVPLDGLYLRDYATPGVKRIAPSLADEPVIGELAVAHTLSNHWVSPAGMDTVHAEQGMADIAKACGLGHG